MLRLERQAPDLSLGIAIGAHAIIIVAAIWNSSITIPTDASLMKHLNQAESTIDIIMFADKVAASVVKTATAAVEQPMPRTPEFRVPELSDGDGLKLARNSVAADAGAVWAMPTVPQRDTTTRELNVDELADGPRYTSFSRAPKLRNPDHIERFLTRHFPLGLRRAGGDARAVVWLLIDTKGQVYKAVLRETSGRGDTDSVAVAASYLMAFEPAEQAGRPVPVWVQQPVRFHVRDAY
ncbi:MAG TPA: TonB family protein [Longimicrobiales bacterium]